MKVKLDKIKHNPYNTREDYGDLSGLKASIERLGLTQPFLVREIDEEYELAFGSRRYEALKQMGAKEVEVEIRNISSPDMAMLSICENVHRKDLNAVEQARAYERGLRATGLSLDKFAETIGEGYGKVKDYLAVLNLPKSILDKTDKYGKMQLIALGRLDELSTNIRIMLENALENKEISTRFLREVVNSCESVYASNLPLKIKKELCGEVIFHDYSALPPENYRDIKTFSEVMLEKSITKYQEGLKKTEKARTRLKGQVPRIAVIRKIKDIVHVDQELDDITEQIRESGSSIQKAIRNNYYSQASRRSRGKFRTAVNHLVSGIEEILENE